MTSGVGIAQFPDPEDLGDITVPVDDDLDVAAYINRHFPDETALQENLDAFLGKLRSAMAHLDAQLSNLVRDQRNAGPRSAELVTESVASVAELRDTLALLSDAATVAERDTRAAMAPMRPLAIALDNTAATASALDALVRLDDAVTTLESATQSASLDRIATDVTIFRTIRECIDVFEALDDSAGPGLRRLPELRARASVATESLRQTILAEFRAMSDVITMASGTASAKSDAAVARLRTACTVTQAIGDDMKMEVVGTYVRGRALAFRAAFEMDSAGLAGVDKRFGWLRRELRVNWARLGGERMDRGWGAVFPDDWGVAWRVADGIVRELRDWTSSTLDAGADRDVAVMVSALSKTKEFEAELDRRFAALSGTAATKSPFLGVISESFGPWMGAYVSQEDEHLQAVIQELVREETWTAGEGAVLKSATELFLVIKKSMRMCASLDIRQPLFSLYKAFRRHLTAYATSLVRHLPGTSGTALGDSSNQKDFDEKLRRTCAIIGTAEYCAATVAQLEESLSRTVQEVYASEIDMSKERERFGTVAAKGVRSLVALLSEDLEPSLREISKQDWASWPAVGDHSPYVEGVGNRLAATIPYLAKQLAKHHFRFLLEKFAASFVPRYKAHVRLCEQMNHFGAQQVLLDATALRAILTGLPNLVHTPAPATYIKFVNREMGKVEAMLKVVLAPVDSSVDTYVALVPEGSAEDFRRILEMRGLRRAETAPLVLEYTRLLGPQHGLRPMPSDGENVHLFSRVVSQGSADSQAGKHNDATSNITAQSRYGGDGTDGAQAQVAAVDSMKNLFGRLGTSLMDVGITDRFEQVSSQFESTADRIKKEAAARGFRFGGNS